MKHKSEVYNIFVNFKIQIEKYSSQSIKTLHSDGGTEFLNQDFKSFLRNNGIVHQVSCPYTPEQNGVVERKHRHIIETTRTLLNTASVPYMYWPDAALTAAYLINRLPSPNTNQHTPFEMLHKSKPNYTRLRVFGCACFPLSPPHSHHKLQNKSKLSIFLGYSDTYKGYKCLDPATNKVHMSRNLTFDETYFPFSKSITGSHNPHDKSLNLPPKFLIPVSIPPAPSRPTPTASLPSMSITNSNPTSSFCNNTAIPTSPSPSRQQLPHHHMIMRNKTGTLKPVVRLNLFHSQSVSNSVVPESPTTFTEAFKYPEWRAAMASEFFALQQQGTWSLIQPPPGASILGCK
ncbi:Retrovirus-related Pol polyprotein from transposon TNT 1-94 [Dendrobium catenatum]|uniref:Retrovirus-related Pol polyprotein from transposon TNT 1-94 n=1 Tax=Dendrobium catenatum TaxID=906689 RepID=A0A2I0VJ27_9ASPA|nr:Retrovirus-related Pol polyprotein from transposon TNT 1-94 [Dendrobium catenatum]